MVATPSMRDELEAQQFKNIIPWSRGVDTDLFHPDRRKDDRGPFKGMKQPIWLNVGRVAVEKNIAAFLDTPLEGTKVIVGDGPQMEALKAKHPDAHFLGVKQGGELADCFANADCFVFPSLTDTFGNVILEALASGCPVAAFPVTGPLDVIGAGRGGVLSEDLRAACLGALVRSRAEARELALTYSWDECARQFLDHVHSAGGVGAAGRRRAALAPA
jgi:glycosyltransferase involved in cell wall biosynthesis